MALFDGTSTKDATIDQDPDVKGIVINSGYTGTISQGAGVSVTVGTEGFEQTAGTFAGSDAAITIQGDFTHSGGSFTSTSGTLSITASSSWTVSGGSFSHNSGTVAFRPGDGKSVSVAGAHTLSSVTVSSGTLDLASATLGVASSLAVANGATLLVSNASAGDVTVSVTDGDHPDIGSSPIRGNASANRHWTVTGGGGLSFDEYGITLHFVSGDVDDGASPSAFRMAREGGGSWSLLSTGAQNATSTEATDITSFSDFAVGEETEPSVETSTIDSDPSSIPADGESTSEITVQLKDSSGNNLTAGGDDVTLSHDPTTGELSGLTDNGDGTYTATLKSEDLVSTTDVELSGTVNGDTLGDTATVRMTVSEKRFVFDVQPPTLRRERSSIRLSRWPPSTPPETR